MIDNALDARYEMAEMLAGGWASADWAGLGLGAAPKIYWEGRESQSPPSADEHHARFFIRHAGGQQGSLSDHIGRQKWDRFGTLMVQCFGTLSGGNGLEAATLMATIAQRAYQGKTSQGCIWFRKVSIEEVGPSGGWYQVNVTATFEYDEVR